MKIPLVDLAPQFLRYERRADGLYYVHVDAIAEAQGIAFLCPLCFERNKGVIGTHQVICWSRSRGVPDDAEPGPGRWALAGTDYADFTLNADPPSGARSVKLETGCCWHGHITNGEAT